MSQPLVSICVPTCNRAHFLQRSLESILAQQHRDFELLIGDNASTDETEPLCRRLAGSDSRIRYIRHPQNIGIYPNHNVLANQAQGEYLCFFHDDDEYEPTILSQEAAFLSKHPEAGIVCPDWTLINEHNAPLGFRDHPVPALRPGLDYIDKTIRSGQSAVGLSGAMVRRTSLGQSRFDETGPIGFGDFVLWFEVAEHSMVGHIPQQLYAYRLHTESLSRKSILSVTRDYRQAMGKYINDHLQRWPAHAAPVKQWRRAIDKYLFWILAYEIMLHCGQRTEQDSAKRYRTVFELMDYRLTNQEFEQVVAEFKLFHGGPLERFMQQGVQFLLHRHWTRPLGKLAPYAPAFRGLLGLH